MQWQASILIASSYISFVLFLLVDKGFWKEVHQKKLVHTGYRRKVQGSLNDTCKVILKY